MIKHYYWPTPNGHKTAIMLEELELEYEVCPVNILKASSSIRRSLRSVPITGYRLLSTPRVRTESLTRCLSPVPS